MSTPIYFIDGEVIAESGNVKVYEMDGEHYLEIGPGHTMWADSGEIIEYADQIGDKAKGDCLEIGLGLGVASNYILDRPKVKSLTSIEKNIDVINVYKELNAMPNDHIIVNQVGVDYMINTETMFDFIFLDFYSLIDEDTLEDIRLYIQIAERILNKGGEIIGWFDIYTLDDLADEFFKLFKN